MVWSAIEGWCAVRTDKVADALQIVVERLVIGLAPERIILFRSRAAGTADDHSDVEPWTFRPS